jgi:uncharacterized protein (TIGR03435 family)
MTFRQSFADRLRKGMDRGFAPYRQLSQGQVDLSLMRVLQQLKKQPVWQSNAPLIDAEANTRRAFVRVASAAAAVLLAVAAAIMSRPHDDRLFRIVEGEALIGDTVRSGDAGTVLTLADGSRVEMRSHSELGVERATDGIRIRLSSGGIIVNAATQPTGHLYVQTKDMTVSVVGTVFLVNAEESGSRVAVIEGEVSIQQGGSEQTLQPGEQVRTNPQMAVQPLEEEISWSKNAVEHIALLEQSAAVSPVEQKPTEPRVAFEAISIRPNPTFTGRARGGGPIPIRISGCEGSFQIQFDPRRFAVVGTTLHALVTWAYGTGPLDYNDCKIMSEQNRVSGGPDWVRTDFWDIQAVVPEGALQYTSAQVKKGNAPKLRTMLRAMLETRFQLVMRGEKQEVSAYVLTAEKGAPRLTVPADLDTPQFRDELINPKEPGVTTDRGAIFVKNAAIAELIPVLERDIGHPILDQTGLTGRYSLFIEFTPLDRIKSGGTLLRGAPALFQALPEQVGLRLTDTKSQVEVWTINRVEKPTEN